MKVTQYYEAMKGSQLLDLLATCDINLRCSNEITRCTLLCMVSGKTMNKLEIPVPLVLKRLAGMERSDGSRKFILINLITEIKTVLHVLLCINFTTKFGVPNNFFNFQMLALWGELHNLVPIYCTGLLGKLSSRCFQVCKRRVGYNLSAWY